MFKRFFSKQSTTLLKRAVVPTKPFLMPTALLAKPFTPVTRVISHPFSTTPVFKTKSEVGQIFRHISNDQFTEAYEASAKLAALDNTLLSKIITYYIESIFSEDQLTKVPDFIAESIKEAEIENLTKDPRALASELFMSLKTLTEFLDKSERGFLTGDLNPKLVLNLQKYVGELLMKNLPSESEEILEDKRNIMIYECFDKIARNCFDGIFRLPLGGIPHPDGENPRNLFERQLILEDESNEIAVEKFLNVYDDLQTLGLSFNLTFARNYIVDWFPNLTRAIKEEQEQCLLGDQKGDRKHYGPYLTKISSEKAALIALTELMKSILKLTHKKKDIDEVQAYHIISKIMFDTIGKAINAQVIFDFEEEMAKAREKKEKQEDTGEPDMGMAGKKKKMSAAARQAALSQKILKKKLSLDTYQSIGIPKSIQIKMGSLLVYLMKETIKVKNEEGFWQNLLTTGYTKVKGKAQYVGILNINEQFLLDLIGKIEKSDSLFIQIDRSLPMVFKPAPWQDHEMGGYYQKPTNFMRIQESHLQERSIKYADLQSTFDVLDILSQTPWRINRRVLNTIEAIWEEGGGAGEIPSRYYNYKNYIYDYQVRECRDQAEKAKLSKKVQLQRDMHSLRCDFSLKLNVAKAFENIEKFYFPHNIDFRGRIYPVPPHLNHIQADICRGLLEFSEGKPIGPNGITWLKIHLANKMGKDKLSFDERIAYAESVIPLVEKVVKDPLAHREWLEAEDSWQTLAAMYDLSDALSNPNPETHISHLHIHQDGSCNGLQHYAALGRDFAGATQVNLLNTERPGDVYTHVAKMVEAKIERDAKDTGAKYHDLAVKLSGNIKRKIVKQTVMTSVYGVTFIGARKQIQKQLKDKDFIAESENDKELYAASHYIALLTLDAIRDLFSGAHEIKKWLIQCAALIANTSNPVSWITPFGLPIIQPYRTKKNIDVISTIIQSVTVSVDTDDLPINKSKQRSAFPPNFIHSLDSTHLMYTALECHKEKITFAAVHDSYWTHAGTIDRMNEILRDQFVKLHSQPLLENLKQSFERRYPEIEFPEIPKRGDFDLRQVKDSMYFFA